jgi:AAA family ATP:ADP antiporter
MTALRRRLLSSVVDVYPQEQPIVFLMFAYSFLAMTSYNIIKPATRSAFIVDLGAENLPFVMLAAGLLMGGLMHLYSRLVNVLPPRWVIPGTQAVIIAISVALWFLLRTGQAWVSAAFFFWGLLLGIFLISQFWTLANDLFDARQAKRLFGFIGGGASLGGMTGATTTALTAERFGTDNLVLVSVCPLVVCFIVAWYVSSHAHLTAGPGNVASANRFRGKEALSLLRQSKHLRLIAGVIGFGAMSAVTLDQQLSMAAEEHVVAEDAITSFLAQVTVYISLIGFVIQVGLTSRVHRRLGIGFALMVLPVSLGATGVVMLLFPVLWAPALARVLNSSLRYTLDKTSREILFLPLSPGLKHSAKPFVDVAVDRFMGKGLGSVVLLVLLKLFNLTWYQLSYVSLALMVLWIALARRARHEYLAVFRRHLHAKRLAPDQMDVPQADLATIDLLVEELGRPEEERVLHAIDMLDSLDRTQHVTPLLLRHHSPQVRARALEVLAHGSLDVARRWEATVEHLLRDESADVRTAAVETLVAIRQEHMTDLMRPYLSDRDPRVVAAAAIALSESDEPEDVETARTAIEQLAHGRPAVRKTALKEAARAVARIPGPRSRQQLIRLLHDPDWEVAHEAIRQIRAGRDPEHAFVPDLVRLLPDRRLRHAARRALACYGEEVVDTLGSVLKDTARERRVRWQLTSTLTLIPCQQSVQVLMDILGDPDAVLRYRTALALGKLRRERDELRFESDRVEESVIRTSARCAKRVEQLSLLHRGHLAGGSLLAAAVLEDFAHSREHLFELFSLNYPWRDMRAARWAIETGDQIRRASAVEYLDNVLSRRLKQHALPMLDRLPMDDGVSPGGAAPTGHGEDVEETLSSLIRDEHPLISVCAIEMVHDRQLTQLAHVLERLRVEPTRDPLVVQSAARVLATMQPATHLTALEKTPSTPDIVKRLSAVPTLAFVPVEELFRLADQFDYIRYRPGQTVFEAGDRADRVELVLDGELVMRERGVDTAHVGPGVLVGLEEVLSGRPMRQAARADSLSVCLSRRADAFLALLSDHVAATEGLFRYYLGLDPPAAGPIVRGAMPPPEDLFPAIASHPDQPLSLAQKALLLEQTSIWSLATGEALLALAAVALELPMREGATLFGASDAPSIYFVLAGELSVDVTDQSAPLTAGRGDELGVMPTLTGSPMGSTARVTGQGAALRVQREDLYEILGDHVDLLRAVFGAVLRDDTPHSSGRRETVPTDRVAPS